MYWLTIASSGRLTAAAELHRYAYTGTVHRHRLQMYEDIGYTLEYTLTQKGGQKYAMEGVYNDGPKTLFYQGI